MGDDLSDRFAGGLVVSALGSVLAAITLFDVYEDAVVQADPLYLTLLENSLPLAVNSALIVAGWLLVTGRLPHVVSARRTTAWSLLGGLVTFVITAWVYYFQIVQGDIKPRIIFSHVVTMGTLAGLFVGIYDGRQSAREAELKTERDRTSALFENSSDCIAAIEYVDGEPILRRANDAFRRTFGVDDDALGTPLDEVMVPPERTDEAERINRDARADGHVETEVFRRTASGETRVFRLQVIPLDTATPTTDAYAVYADITEQHRYESRMTALHDATRGLLDADSVEEITDRAVRAAADVLGLEIAGIYRYDPATDRLEPATQTDEATELVGDPDPFERGDAIAWSVFESGDPEYVDDVHARPDAYAESSPLRSEIILPLGGWGVFMIGSESRDAFDGSDVSLSRTLAANVEAAIDRAQRREELRRRNERLDTFASVVSHDLRNPLGVAEGFLSLAREGDAGALDRIDEALDRMDRLIETLLTLARSGEDIGDPEPIRIGDVAEAAWETVETDGATLVVDADPGSDGTVRADRTRLRQLFENLFRNSIEHGSPEAPTEGNGSVDSADPREPELTVRVVSFPGGFAVEDDGVGIPESERGAVLEHGHTTSEEGTGLGLTIVREIAAAHGWSVSVGASATGGARFEFTVPEAA